MTPTAKFRNGGLILDWAVAGFVVAATRMRNRNAPFVDLGLEYAAFLKISALISVAGLALLALLFVPESVRTEIAALFGLLGTIAGYVAAKDPSTSGPPAPPPPPVQQVPAGEPEAPAAGGMAAQVQAAALSRSYRRSLL